ncbi:uncharacterized protein LOC128559403 [Mercenaria mercenaria]|uniref:uncharacterized protein LOC128559403 n=1 Tax=Mercenaria mercenaria TaxID=6596 RepID=UPI00234E65CA|nr:uncharacterized protein LOC128559403 [Mercenaria mercenaria]
MATRENGIPRIPDKNNPRTEQYVHQNEQSRMDQTNSLKNEDVKYPPNIPAGQFSKSSRTPLSSTRYGGNSLSSTTGSTQQSAFNATGGRLLSESLHEKGKTTVHGKANLLTKEKVNMKSVFYNFSPVIEKSLNVKHSTVSVKFERNSENAICILRGTPDDVKNAKITLQDMEKTLYETKVIFSTKTGDAFRDFSIEDIISDLLKDQYPACVAQQLTNEVLLYGFDKGVVENAKKFLSKSIKETDILLCGRLRENKNHVIEHFENKYKNKIVVYVDNVCRLHMVGQTEVVKEASTECVDINEGRKSLSTEGIFSNLQQEVTSGFGPEKLKPLSTSYKETVCPQELTNTTTTSEPQEKVLRNSENLRQMRTSIITDGLDISSPNSVEYFTMHQNESEVDFCIKKFGVFLERKLVFTRGKLKVINELHNDNSLRSSSEGKRLAVEHSSFESLRADVKFLPSRIDPNKGGRFTAKENIIEMAVPYMVNGGQEDYKELETILSKALEKVSAGSNVTSVAFRIWPVANWDFDNLMKCMLDFFVNWLLTRSHDKPISVLLCTEEHKDFICTDEYICNCLRTKLEATELKLPTVRIVKGSLDKAVAAVIVNTTACTLDLSYGKVSSALLKAAGQELQNECKQHHPTGIRYDEIAVIDMLREYSIMYS